MTKLMTLLVGCSLALVGSAQAEQQNPKKKPAPKSKPVQQQHAPKQQHVQKQQHPATSVHVPNAKQPKIQNTNGPKQHHPPTSVQSDKLQQIQSNKMRKVNKPLPMQSNVPQQVQSKKLATTRPNQETVQRIKSQHTNFHARPATNVASVAFNQNYRIRGAENWSGARYAAFRSYHPEWHDRSWWHSHHHHIVLIGGGWYFWNAGFWYPAWGYDTATAYYPYDGPIYVGSTPRPFDRVVADVQALLQEQGYYRGEVDGLVGPLTQDALAAYQQDQGLVVTSAIDPPTLDSLGLT